METKKRQIEREKRAREAEINSLVNRPPGSPLDRPPLLESQEFSISVDELYAAARENSPMLKRERRMIQRSETAVNMARKEYYPDFALNGGYYTMGRMPDMFMFRADFRIPLYFFRKQRAGVTEQSQRLVEARRMFEATNQSLHYRIQDDYTMAQTAHELAQIYAKTIIPQAALALESSLASYETGRVDFLTVLTNHIGVVDYEMNYYEELQNYYLALARLEEMTGRRLIR
jgi:outer membrane protein TolC